MKSLSHQVNSIFYVPITVCTPVFHTLSSQTLKPHIWTCFAQSSYFHCFLKHSLSIFHLKCLLFYPSKQYLKMNSSITFNFMLLWYHCETLWYCVYFELYILATVKGFCSVVTRPPCSHYSMNKDKQLEDEHIFPDRWQRPIYELSGNKGCEKEVNERKTVNMTVMLFWNFLSLHKSPVNLFSSGDKTYFTELLWWLSAHACQWNVWFLLYCKGPITCQISHTMQPRTNVFTLYSLHVSQMVLHWKPVGAGFLILHTVQIYFHIQTHIYSVCI